MKNVITFVGESKLKMNVKEFSQRCRVTPQVVRLWIRQGKVVREGTDLKMSQEYHLLPRLGLVRYREGMDIVESVSRGCSDRTVRNWIQAGRVSRKKDGSLVARGGWCFIIMYKPVREGEEKGKKADAEKKKEEQTWK